MNGSMIWILAAFAVYLIMMIVIGAFYSKKNNSSEDYFLGGRKLSGFVAALSAQASDEMKNAQPGSQKEKENDSPKQIKDVILE